MKTDTEIKYIQFDEKDEIAKIIYENIFQRDHRGIYRPYLDCAYCAPETQEGFAVRACIEAANIIRSKTQ